MNAVDNVVKGDFNSGQPDPLAKKVAEVMAEVEAIEKRGEFKVGTTVRYNYVQATDLYEAVREKLSSRGIAFVARFGGIEFEKEKQTQGGGTLHTVGIRVNLELRDSETSTSIYADWLGVGMDSGDKAVAKAFTGAVKTWLMTTFLVPSDTDPDDGGESGSKRKAATPKATAEERKQLAAHLKGYIRNQTDEVQVKLRLKTLGVSDTDNVSEAVNKLGRDKALTLFKWLDDELVKRQGATA